jgi:hypothetical protein
VSCSPKFTKEVSFACVLEIVNDFRAGKLDKETFKKILWLSGCGLEVLGGDVTTMSVLTFATMEDAILALEKCCYSSGMLSSDQPKTEDWTIIVPIVFELIRLWLENRRK